MTPDEFRAERTKLLRAIKARLKPLLYPSGYQIGPIGKSRPLLVWLPRDKNGELARKKLQFKGAFVLHAGFEGFTEEGVIDDSYGHGLSTIFWAGLPIEDLYRLNLWMQRMLPKLTANDKPIWQAAQSAAVSKSL